MDFTNSLLPLKKIIFFRLKHVIRFGRDAVVMVLGVGVMMGEGGWGVRVGSRTSETKKYSVKEWCVMEYGTGALWDL